MSGLARPIMDAIAAALADLPNCRQIEPRMNLSPDEPCIDIYPWVESLEETDERGFGEGPTTGALLFTVRARVGTVDYDSGQDILIDWMDPTNDEGVAALLEADEFLGEPDIVSSVGVGAVSGFISFVDINGQVSRIGAQWRVRVIPAHS